MQTIENITSKPVQIVDTLDESRIQLAKDRDARVRELEGIHIGTWSEMADLCRLVEEQQDWAILGYGSYHRWLLSAAPQSRSTMYAARRILAELRDVSKESLKQIPVGSAKVLAAVPKRSRTPNLIAQAKRPPKEFKALVQEKYPDLHIESTTKRSFEFSRQQEKIVDGAIAMCPIIESGEWTEESEMSDAEALTLICKDYLDRHGPTFKKIKADR